MFTIELKFALLMLKLIKIKRNLYYVGASVLYYYMCCTEKCITVRWEFWDVYINFKY